MLYTRKGDKGESGLFGSSARLPKDSPIYEALGSLDELNSLLGLCRARARTEPAGEMIDAELLKVQECLFIAQAEVAGSDKKLDGHKVAEIEKAISVLEDKISNPHSFVIPGANEFSALLDFARAVSRRTERAVVRIAAEREISDGTKAYLNRLSSLLYAEARYIATLDDSKETKPSY